MSGHFQRMLTPNGLILFSSVASVQQSTTDATFGHYTSALARCAGRVLAHSPTQSIKRNCVTGSLEEGVKVRGQRD